MSIHVFLLAALARAIGALPHDGNVRGLAALARVAMQATAAWLLVLGSQSAVPIWSLLAATLFSALVRTIIPGRQAALVSDVGLVLIIAAAAQPGLAATTLAASVILFAMAGHALDLLARRMPTAALTRLSSLAVVTAVAALPFLAWQYRAGIWSQVEPIPFMAVSLPQAGTRVTLPTGSVAWRLEPRGTPRATGILFLHGAHSAGAKQSTAIAFRAALLGAGYPVLSLDTMGYGSSPVPRELAAVAQWDERPHLAAALRYLRDEMGAVRVVVIGHSMGCNSAMRSLQASPTPERAILFGAAMVQELGKDDYWLERFHQDRRLPPGSVSMATWKSVHGAHFDGRNIARSLAPDHAPIVQVHFERDHDDVQQTRGQYALVLSGEYREFTLAGTNHYLNTTTADRMPVLGRVPWLRNAVFLDSRVVSRLRERLPDWIEGQQ